MRRVRDAILLDVAFLVGWHVVTNGIRLWLSWTAPRPVIDESLIGRLVDELVR